MVYMVRSVRTEAAKDAEAVQWAVKVAAYVNETYPSINVRVLRNINGPLQAVHWAVRYESLAALEEISAKLGADAGYQELLAETEGMFVPGTLVDNLYRTVE